MKKALIELLKVKSIITLAIVGGLIYLSVVKVISPQLYSGFAASIITYYFNRKEK